ncbi:MAG: 30S ribosomal protein S21 [Saprospiraceae bacterium]|nr:30S ribosomal protein S21 [Saprospiraceae bacterium]
MIIINVKDGETIDRALKRYKQKHRRIGVMNELRERKHFSKPSVERRNEILKARYKLKRLIVTSM